MSDNKQPLAYGYTQHWPPPISKSEPPIGETESAITAHFKQVIEPQGVTWGGMVVEPASERKCYFHSMPEAYKLLKALRPGDHLVVAWVGSAFATFMDFKRVVDRLRRSKQTLHVVEGPFNSSNDAQVAGLEDEAAAYRKWSAFEACQLRRRRQACNARRQAEGRHVAGSPPMGFKAVGPPGGRTLVPDEEARETMRAIVEMRNIGHGFGAIAAYLTKNSVMWKRRVAGKRGCSYEFWDRQRVERAYWAMRDIMEAENAEMEMQRTAG